MTDFHVLIPARLASTRLPNKPLADIGGRPMIVHVAQRAQQSGAAAVVVATDSTDVAAACAAHGLRCVMTRDDHPSGSDRLAEACEQLGLDGEAIVVNVQGDEPMMPPALIGAVAACLETASDCVASTAAHAIGTVEDFLNPNVVKVTLDHAQRALTFSRAPLPWWRDGMSNAWTDRASVTLPEPAPLRHLGIYAYRAGFLRQFPGLTPAPLEKIEALEQLRLLWHGHRMVVHLAHEAPGPGVDTPEDLARVRALLGSA